MIEMLGIVRSGSLGGSVKTDTVGGVRLEVRSCGLSMEKILQLALGLYRRNGDKASEEHILKYSDLIYPMLFRDSRFEDMETLLSAKPPLAAVDEMQGYAIKTGAHEMYVMLEKYKEENGGFDAEDRFEL